MNSSALNTDDLAEIGNASQSYWHTRFGNLEDMLPFQFMFVDNKQYPCAVRGGYKETVVFIDCKTRSKLKIDLCSKEENGRSVSERGGKSV